MWNPTILDTVDKEYLLKLLDKEITTIEQHIPFEDTPHASVERMRYIEALKIKLMG